MNNKFKYLGFWLGMLVFCGLATPSFGKIMSGPLPQKAGRPDSVFKFIGNVGVGIADSAAQGTRFVGNIVSLDVGSAFKNIVGVVSKNSIDSFLIEFVGHLPQVLEKNLHLRYKANGSKVIENYLLDGQMDEQETAAVLNFLLEKQSPAQQKETITNLKNVLHLIKDGTSMSTEKVGQVLKNSMKEAIRVAPKPLPILGSPVSERRLTVINKAFAIQLIREFGVGIVQSAIKEALKDLNKAGLSISGMIDQRIIDLIEAVSAHFNIEACIEQAENQKDLLKCTEPLQSKQLEISYVILNNLKKWIDEKKISIHFIHNDLARAVDLGRILSQTLEIEKKSLEELSFSENQVAAANLINRFAQNVGKEMGQQALDNILNPANTLNPNPHLQKQSQVLVSNFFQHAEIVKPKKEKVIDYLRRVYSYDNLEKAHSELDNNLREPLKKSLEMSSSKIALFNILNYKIGFNESTQRSLEDGLKTFLNNQDLKNSSLDPAFHAYVKNFTQAAQQLANPPEEQAVMSYFRSLVDPSSLSSNKLLAGFREGAHDLFSFLSRCETNNCPFLNENAQNFFKFLGQTRRQIDQSPWKESCNSSLDRVTPLIFDYIEQSKVSLVAKPILILEASKDVTAQRALNCVLSAQALKAGAPESLASKIYNALELSLELDLDNRFELITDLKDYLSLSSEDKEAAKRRFISRFESHAKKILKILVDQNIAEYKAEDLKPFFHEFIDSTQWLDPETKLSLEAYAKQLSVEPVQPNSPLDKALKNGLQKTLENSNLRKLVLKSALNFSQESPALGFIGPGLIAQLEAAYESADLTQDPIRFAPQTPEGVASFLRDFDHTLKTFSGQMRTDESFLVFFKRIQNPKSKFLDQLLAKNSNGLGDLIVSLLKCDKSISPLCHTCMGTQGNWLRIDPKNKLTEVLIRAPGAEVMNILSHGFRNFHDPEKSAFCQKEMPLFIKRALEIPAASSQALLSNPSLFLDALKKKENEGALRCVTSQYLEIQVLRTLRLKFIGAETQIRELLKGAGIQSDAALGQLRGDELFDVLKRHENNPVLNKKKLHLVEALQKTLDSKDEASRRELVNSLQDFTSLAIAGGSSDPYFAYELVTGSDYPWQLAKKAETHSLLAKEAISCMNRHYTDAILPISVYLGEDLSRKLQHSRQDWIRDPASKKDLAPSQESDASGETCRQEGFMKAPTSTPAALAYSWVGGFEHTLRASGELHQAQGLPFPSKAEQARINRVSADLRDFILHLRERKALQAGGSGFLDWLGDRYHDGSELIPRGAHLLSYLNEVRKFRHLDYLKALDTYLDAPNSKNQKALEQLIARHCASYKNWEEPKKANSSVSLEPHSFDSKHTEPIERDR